ncbi:unnamed protein product [Prorocentrum cordatum]|uniref:Uncharacterized protein n=1 Tax=Prorocentrum cordatum TaxID=2364126 RepID=A0ABN9V4D0_9DINO|nr:unnamed protein product [Polarella glacialis]
MPLEVISNYTDCITSVQGWLGEDGVDLCLKRQFATASQQVACVENAYYPFYRSNGLNWNKVPAVQKAMELCKAADFDADEALSRSECSVRAWSSGDAARAGCLTMPLEVISNYTDCITSVQGWLGEDGVDLCLKRQFATASQQVACVEKAYYPFYRSNGLNWNKVPAVQKAMELCKAADFDADEALRRSECSVRAWSSGDAARAGCLTMPLEVISNYTDCITSVQGWLGEDGVDLCLKRQFATASQQVACVEKAYYPFYRSNGLNWNKVPAVQKAMELCKAADFDADEALRRSECSVRAWSSGDAARAGCLTMPLEVISNYTDCITSVQGWLGEDGVAF